MELNYNAISYVIVIIILVSVLYGGYIMYTELTELRGQIERMQYDMGTLNSKTGKFMDLMENNFDDGEECGDDDEGDFDEGEDCEVDGDDSEFDDDSEYDAEGEETEGIEGIEGVEGEEDGYEGGGESETVSDYSDRKKWIPRAVVDKFVTDSSQHLQFQAPPNGNLFESRIQEIDPVEAAGTGPQGVSTVDDTDIKFIDDNDIESCTKVFKSGKNKGEQCNKIAMKGRDYCRTHQVKSN